MQPVKPNHKRVLELPVPDENSARHSRRVADYIHELIQQSGGNISFAEFMQHALYSPGLGYYSAGSSKFGAAGDYVTAPEVSAIFGRVLATQCAHVLQQVAEGRVLEPGAGSGALAVSMLRRLEELGQLPDRYLILEISADLKQRQHDLLFREVPHLADRVTWLSGMPKEFSGVIVVNEVADALPVERFLKKDGDYHQLRVASVDGEFVWQLKPAQGKLRAAIQKLEGQIGQPFADGYLSEISLGLDGWICDLVRPIKDGFVFLFDYGVSRCEYYAAERNEGWLRCHFRHHAHDDPLILPGIQDVTAWVDFTAVAEAASGTGMSVAGYVSQAQFLLGAGLDTELAEFDSLPVKAQLKLSQEIKLLTLPSEMGENFKCLGCGRGIITAPPAFAAADRQHTL